MKNKSQVEQTIDLFLAGVQLTTKKLARLIRCGSATSVLKRAIETLAKMGLIVSGEFKPVRGGKRTKHYNLEVA